MDNQIKSIDPLKPSLDNNNNIKPNENIFDLLMEIPIIKELPFATIKLLNNEFIKKVYKKNEYIIKQGEEINDIYLIIKGSFVLTLNHCREYNVEQDIDTFIKYQNITEEPFNTDRNYEIKGKINKNEEIELFIYQRKNFFGDIETVSNQKNSLFNIKSNEDNSVLCVMEREKWCSIIKKILDKFGKIVENKLDIIKERINVILTKKQKLKYDKLNLSHERIYCQIIVNNNFDICSDKLNNINRGTKNNLINRKAKSNRRKYFIKKNISIIKNKRNKEKNSKNKEKSKSVLNLSNCKNRVMELFKFPVIIKNETKSNFKHFFDSLYSKKDKKRVKLNETKIDSVPIYINRFRHIFDMNSKQKCEFLNFMKNYLDNNYNNEVKNDSPSTKIRRNKSNIQELFSMYNYYVNYTHENTNSTNYSKQIKKEINPMSPTLGVLKTSLKDNYLKNNLRSNSFINRLNLVNNSYTSTPVNKLIKLEPRDNNQSKFNIYNSEGKLKLKKIKFNNQIENYSRKNYNEIDSISQNNININENKKIKNSNKHNNPISLNKNIKRLSATTSSDKNSLFKNSKINNKTVYEILLKNKSDNIRAKIFENIGGGKSNEIKNEKNNKFIINNNFDIRDDKYIKNLLLGTKFNRAKSFNEDKFINK